jgi:hypothetical protein
MSIKRLSIKGLIKNPKFASVYKDYDRLSVDDYGGLLVYLYSGRTGKWENPLTHVELKRNSNIILSFLSFCYYKLDDGSKVDIKGHNMTYKEHVLNFIDEIYLYEEDRKATTARSAASASASPRSARSAASASASPRSPASPRFARSPSPTRGTSQAARGAQQAALAQQAAPAQQAALAAKSSSSSGKMSYSPTASYKAAQSIIQMNDTTNRLTKEQALNFVKELRALKKGKTPAQIKMLTIKNPITSSQIGLKGQAFQRLIHKLYNYDDEDLKKAIRKVVSTKFLDDINAHIDDIKTVQNAAADKVKEAKRLAALAAIEAEKQEREINRLECEKTINEYMADFHTCCDKLTQACDANGVIKEYDFITDVVNAIVVVILTKYLHLNYYYDDLYKNYKYDAPLPICLIMFDDEMKEYCDKKKMNVVAEMIDYSYNKGTIIYQNNELKQDISKELIDKIPRDIDGYYQNTLLNRQYIFDIRREDLGGNISRLSYIKPALSYNQYNNLNIGKFVTTPFQSLQFPHTLGYAYKQFEYKPFNYNITNSGLPRTIFVTATDEVLNRHKPFSELIGEINERLARLPRITGVALEATEKLQYYRNILNDIEAQSFGINDDIRQNILYSLNAVTTKYRYFKPEHLEKDFFYNYKYSGMFPIFTWVPLNQDPKKWINNLINIMWWQPFGYVNNKLFKALGDAYKNFRVPPFSKGLNEAIYKIITDAHSSVLGLPISTFETDRLIERVKKTVGFYKDLELDPQYIIDNLYFYHGSPDRLHTMKDRENDIQILGFLSTTLNIYTASYYSGVVTKGSGYIYIIETDDKKGYINLNDELYQFLILPNSIIRILYEFQFCDTTIILCRLIMTPTKEDNNALYNNLLGIPQPAKKSDDAAGAGASSSSSSSSSSAASVSGGKLKERARDAYASYASYVIQPTKTAKAAKSSHSNTKDIIKPKADMRKIGDMPADIREYYGITLTEQNKNDKVDINNGCYVRMINRKVVDRMLAGRV